ncbi:MAG: ABC transporter substrate-binding protein [Flavobacteriales bacterium]
MRFEMLIPWVLVACVRSSSPSATAGWKDIPNSHACGFLLQERDGERRALVFGPHGPTDTLAVIAVPDRPPERIAALSTTHIPFILALGAGEELVGAAYCSQVPDPRFKDLLAAGRVVELLRGDRLDGERYIALAPDVLFDQMPGIAGGVPPIAGALRIPVPEYLEHHPLGRSEWIRFFGALLGRQEQADSIHAGIVARYHAVRDRVRPGNGGPRVFFGSAWGGRFHAAAGNSYMARLIRDAGGRYFLADTLGGSIAMDLESFIGLTDSLEHIGMVLSHPGVPGTVDLAQGDPRLLQLRALTEGGFYGNSSRSDLFGQALLEPDVLLADLAHVFDPAVTPDHRPKYFQTVAQSPIP